MFKSCAVLLGLIVASWALVALVVWGILYAGGLLNEFMDSFPGGRL
jgi:hypothetical protein